MNDDCGSPAVRNECSTLRIGFCARNKQIQLLQSYTEEVTEEELAIMKFPRNNEEEDKEVVEDPKLTFGKPSKGLSLRPISSTISL
jgi:hypothetical protein